MTWELRCFIEKHAEIARTAEGERVNISQAGIAFDADEMYHHRDNYPTLNGAVFPEMTELQLVETQAHMNEYLDSMKLTPT